MCMCVCVCVCVCVCLIKRKQQENGDIYIKKGFHNSDSSIDIIGDIIREII